MLTGRAGRLLTSARKPAAGAVHDQQGAGKSFTAVADDRRTFPAVVHGVRKRPGKPFPPSLSQSRSVWHDPAFLSLRLGGTGKSCGNAGTLRTGGAWPQQQGDSPRLREEG